METEGKVKNMSDAKAFVNKQGVKFDKVMKHKEKVFYFVVNNPNAPKYPRVVATYFDDISIPENIFIEK